MKNKMIKTILCVLIGNWSIAQIGINQESPKTTLHITGTFENNVPDGLLIPRYTATELNDKNTAYDAAQYSALVYIISGTGTIGTKTENIDGSGFYFYDMPDQKWKKLSFSSGNFGTVKTGLQATDHNGWIKLDGRSIGSLTPMQQIRATSLGLSGNIPDMLNAILLQNGATLGSITPQNMILQHHLPDVNLTGSTSTDGEHSHTFTGATYDNLPVQSSGAANSYPRAVQTPVVTSAAGDHSHIVETESLNGGVLQNPLGLPQTLSVNVFMYLGN